jgi:hypothetical protein
VPQTSPGEIADGLESFDVMIAGHEDRQLGSELIGHTDGGPLHAANSKTIDIISRNAKA